MMLTNLVTMDTERKKDITNILIIIVVALGLGVYLAVTTVVISKDGVGYIERARRFYDDPGGSLTTHHPGYPLLIFTAHKMTFFPVDDSSVFTWIYTAQSITLLFRLLAIIPLHFIGKRLVGSKASLYAMIILIILPNPAKMGSEVTREWPYMFFLAAGFLFLLLGARGNAPWIFGLAGLSAGLGYWIRPECGQIVIYGLGWLILSLILPAMGKITRRKTIIASAMLLIGFALPVLPYAKLTGNIIAPNAEHIIKSISLRTSPGNSETSSNNISTTAHYTAGFTIGRIPQALSEIVKTSGENLMWFFLPFLLIGLSSRMRHFAGFEERFLFIIFILTNLIMMVVRYCYVEAHISYRWTLPLIAFTICYIPIGLESAVKKYDKIRTPRMTTDGEQRLFLILLLTGMVICLPKLFRPAGWDKRNFLAAATWLNENTGKDDIVAVPDPRISFYAEREGVLYREGIPEEAKFIVRIIEGNGEEQNYGPETRKEFSLPPDKRRKEKGIAIYRIL